MSRPMDTQMCGLPFGMSHVPQEICKKNEKKENEFIDCLTVNVCSYFIDIVTFEICYSAHIEKCKQIE